ncbi:NUDIX hydrolase [Stieleria sp. TO1_6]|uniref:NUDIX hydrolase n=1 Tax=Stieleria tagensis TaxID=2956795 RepID=UPI00209ADDFB|nr:NUDIX domain-containing protein [Stieleria tagensis]MCO8125332.1 NUDIX hydrolase [Stieleria tagensis]
MTFEYSHARPALTVDCVVFGLDQRKLQVLLIQRDLPPFRGDWALPGGFVQIDETLESAARRELREETGLEQVYLEQLSTYGAVDRDPRERVVTVAWYALVRMSDHRVMAATDARDAAWYGIDDLPSLAFDHDLILQAAQKRLQNKVQYQPIGFELLPKKFSLSQLQFLYETILDRELDKRNFRKKILSLGVLQELDEYETNVAHRAARLYRFDRRQYQRMLKQGVHFEI